MLELVFFIIGAFIGFTMRDQQIIDRYNQSYDQINQKMRHDLELYKNLSESYKHDSERMRLEIKRLKSKYEA